MKLTKSQLKEIIREELTSLSEITYAPLPDQYADRLRAMGSGKSKTDGAMGKSKLSFSQRTKIRERIGRLETQLITLRDKFAELNFEMEQTAEPEGGKKADRIGSEMEKVLTRIQKLESDINILRKQLL
jgi:outer membrane murein-binding lipoprotein Lpp